MTENTTPVLLVTANVGSVFEDPSVMLKIWTKEFLSTVSRLEPKFLALHCQEVGGKNYERSMKNVEYFVRLLMTSEELRLFDKVHVYLDEDYSSAEHFTALGNLYFIHESITDVLVWDFSAKSFVQASGKEVHCGNIETISSKEKSKFPQDFFPECKWSRKGFLRTRWNLNGTVFDLINIHLFHDASNFVAMESFPSVYCKNRRRALEHTLDRFHNDSNGIAPFFLFGDFNFRTDAQGVVQKLSEGLNAVRVQGIKNTDHSKLQYRDDASKVVLSLGKKEFSHRDHQTVFFENDAMWLKEFDHELEPFEGRLFEFPISFPPSYPFEEDEKGAKYYMQTRCPSWCDRIVLSSTAKSLVHNISDSSSVEYGIIGSDTCMGDHKPVYLKLDLKANAGTVKCCSPLVGDESSPLHYCSRYLPENAWPCTKRMTLDTDHLFVPDSKKPVTLFEAISINVDSDNHLLIPAPQPFEPYTPESVDTPSLSPSLLHLDQFKDAVEERLNTYSSLQNAHSCDNSFCTCDNCDGNSAHYDKHSVTVPRKKLSQCSLNANNASYPFFRWLTNSDDPRCTEKKFINTNNPEIIVHDSDCCNTVEHRYLGLEDNILDKSEDMVVKLCNSGKLAPVVSVESLSHSLTDSEDSALHDIEMFRCHSYPSVNRRSPVSRANRFGRLRSTLSCGEESHFVHENSSADLFAVCALSHVNCGDNTSSSSLNKQALPSNEPRKENISPGTTSYLCRSLADLAQDEHSEESLPNIVVNYMFPNSRDVLRDSVVYPNTLSMIIPNNNDEYCSKETSKCLERNSLSRQMLETKSDGEIECDSLPLKHFEEKTVITSLPLPEETDVIQLYSQNKHRRFSCCCVN